MEDGANCIKTLKLLSHVTIVNDSCHSTQFDSSERHLNN